MSEKITYEYETIFDFIGKKMSDTGRSKTAIVTELAENAGMSQSTYYNVIADRRRKNYKSNFSKKIALFVIINKEAPASEEVLKAFFNKEDIN